MKGLHFLLGIQIVHITEIFGRKPIITGVVLLLLLELGLEARLKIKNTQS